MNNVQFHTKARVLDQLKSKLSVFSIPEMVFFTIESWRRDTDRILNYINQIQGASLIIRSSATDEDQHDNSSAGQYESVSNIQKNNSIIKSGIEQVISSYSKKENFSTKNEVIVQKQIQDVSMSGVLFSHDINTGAPYYVINYDDETGSTDSVTSGKGEYSNRTLYIHRDYDLNQLKSSRFKTLLKAVKELEANVQSTHLDIEFALDKDLNPYLFQVRTITTVRKWNKEVLKSINYELENIETFVKRCTAKQKFVFGSYSVLAQMPDWNPVELIGRVPKRLDYSLYQTLITDRSWRIARKTMGYHESVGKSLMVSLGGQPFIDTRLSFNSFLPNDLPDSISEKLVGAWLKNLKDNPHLHDKVEFEVAITCYSFDIEEKLNAEYYSHLSKEDKAVVINSFRKLTFNLIRGNSPSSIDAAIKKINLLNKIHHEKYNDIDTLSIKELNAIIEETITLGIIPFAILARHGFIAKTIFESLKEVGIVDESFIDTFYKSVSTVASDFHYDSIALQNRELTAHEFLKKYGHLRPGTYDITSLRYDQMKEDFFYSSSESSPHSEKKMSLSKTQEKQINTILKEHQLDPIESRTFLKYVSQAIKGREYAKFIFTKNVSVILEIIARFATENGFSREDISNLDISEIIAFNTKSIASDVKSHLTKIIARRKNKINLTNAIRLPQLIADASGVYVIPFQVSHPNFITNNVIEGEVIFLTDVAQIPLISNKIVMIENADPGYDFIFNSPIKGLITKYGGANSHMAIRCSEFDIPAAIGCGEQIFESLNNTNIKVKLDCLTNKLVRLI